MASVAAIRCADQAARGKVAIMHRIVMRVVLLLAFVGAGLASAQAQEWRLNGKESHFYMETAKADSIVEVAEFSGLEGAISKDGDASVKIDLQSVASGIDVRDTRMRFLLFETFKFPAAEITAKLDMAKLDALRTATRIAYPLKFTLALHGISKDIEAPVFVTRLNDKSVSVTPIKPIIVTAAAFGMTEGIAKLSSAVNNTPIVSGASITFDLIFETP